MWVGTGGWGGLKVHPYALARYAFAHPLSRYELPSHVGEDHVRAGGRPQAQRVVVSNPTRPLRPSPVSIAQVSVGSGGFETRLCVLLGNLPDAYPWLSADYYPGACLKDYYPPLIQP